MKTTYDELVYKSKSFPFTAPICLESYAYLYGLNPVNSRKARVLELGSSFGGNIITQALYNPDSHYVGIDLSEEQVNIGNEIIKEIGLKNIELLHKNILDIDEDFGKFDYIIVHGVFSWVPDDVKEKIMSICDKNMTEQGIAYISYNTLPGWKERQKVRDMMCYVNKYYPNESLNTKTERGKIFLEIVSDQINLYPDLSAGRKVFLDIIKEVNEKENYYVGHEYLETFNDAIYLHDFADMLAKYNLRYFTDTSLRLSFVNFYHKDIVEKVKQLSKNDNVIKEQCLDFILDTMFRKSLICKRSQDGLLNFTENIPNQIFDNFTYKLLCPNENIDNFPNLQKLYTYLKPDTNIFNIKDIKNVDNSVKSIILNCMVEGTICAYTQDIKPNKFKENKSYIPEKFIKYVEVILPKGGDKFISLSDKLNLTINGINVADLFIMNLLTKPTTLKEVMAEIDKAGGIVFTNQDKKTVLNTKEYLEDAIRKFEHLDYFVDKK